jgi:hypothetical protein
VTDRHGLPADYHFGGWEGHADEERRARLATTPAQRLAWLEQAIRFAHGVASRRGDEEGESTSR